MSISSFALFGRLLVMMGSSLTPLKGAADPAIVLVCQPSTAETAPICEQMQAVIAAANPGTRVTITTLEAVPAEALAVRLQIEALDDRGLSAILGWRRPGQAWQSDAPSSLSVMDTTLKPPMIARFLELLWNHSPLGPPEFQRRRR